MHKAFWFGLIGGVFGIIASLLVAAVGSFLTALAGIGIGILISAVIAIIFSIVGIAAGLMDSNKRTGGVLMIVSGAIVLLTISFLGILTFTLFLIGGILMLIDQTPKRIVIQQPAPSCPQPLDLTPPTNPEDTRCRICNSPVTLKQAYCGNCGAKLS